MARLLIVSRSMALAMRLADQHDVTEHPADKVQALAPDPDTDVLVLDIGDPIRAVTTVNDLREAGYSVPVLLVSGYQPEWEQVESQEVEGVRVVPLPITRAALLDGVSALLEETPPASAGQMDVVVRTGVPSTGGIPVTPQAGIPVQAVVTQSAEAADEDELDTDVAETEDAEIDPENQNDDDQNDDDQNDDVGGIGDTAVEDEHPDQADPVADDRDDDHEEETQDEAARPDVAQDDDAQDADLQDADLQDDYADEEDESDPEADDETEAARLEDLRAAAALDAEAAEAEAVRVEAAQLEADQAEADQAEAAQAEAARVEAARAEADVLPESQPQRSVRIEPTTPPWEEVLAPAARPATRWGRFSRGSSEPAPQTPGRGAFTSGGQNGNPGTGNISTGGNGTGTPNPGVLNPGAPNTGAPNTGAPNTGAMNTGAMSTGNFQRPGLGDRPRKFQRHASSNFPAAQTASTGSGLVTDPLGPRTDPRGFAASGLDRRLDDEAGALLDAATIRDANGVAWRTADLIQVLIDSAPNLYGVSDTAQVLADDVIEKADADAAAILVPDGPLWRVSGGVGLRPLERRLILDEQHWLITEIGTGGRAVLIEDTDIVRQQLSGAPLAAWRHLLAVPVPDVHAIVVLARGQEAGPFSDRDLSVVFSPVREAAPLLAQAVEIRRLARLLGPLREQDPEVVRRTQQD